MYLLNKIFILIHCISFLSYHDVKILLNFDLITFFAFSHFENEKVFFHGSQILNLNSNIMLCYQLSAVEKR